MLVLSRKEGEKIVLPSCGVTVTVIGVVGNQVRLGIAAPPQVAIHREEVWTKIATGNDVAPRGPSHFP